MEAAGIDTTQDVRFRVVPASQMISFLSADVIDGYCVGEPWGSLAVTLGLGRVAITSPEIFAGCLEKVFAVTKEWADKNRDLHIEVIQALIEAAKWCDGNRYELAELLAQPRYVNAPVDAIAATLVGGAGLSADLMIFHRWCANFPWRSQAMWYLEQMKRWGTVPLSQDSRMAAEQVYRPDLYRQAAQALGIPTPKTDYKSEGNHPRTWILENADCPIEMGPDLLLDGAVFDPHSINSSLPKGITVSGDMT
jgi:nitrate/nitrite transport system substrate-binding protein